jgi:hypothetical protein
MRFIKMFQPQSEITTNFQKAKINSPDLYINPELKQKNQILEDFKTRISESSTLFELNSLLNNEFSLITLKLSLNSDEKINNLKKCILESQSVTEAKKYFVALIKQHQNKLKEDYQFKNSKFDEELDFVKNEETNICDNKKNSKIESKTSRRIKSVILSAFLMTHNLFTPFLNSFEKQQVQNVTNTDPNQLEKIDFYAKNFEEMAQKINESKIVSKEVNIQLSNKSLTIKLDEKLDNTTSEDLEKAFDR